MMSHGAVVAREYGIPAVVGVAEATDMLRTGQMVTVDGSAGIVILEGGEATDGRQPGGPFLALTDPAVTGLLGRVKRLLDLGVPGPDHLGEIAQLGPELVDAAQYVVGICQADVAVHQ